MTHTYITFRSRIILFMLLEYVQNYIILFYGSILEYFPGHGTTYYYLTTTLLTQKAYFPSLEVTLPQPPLSFDWRLFYWWWLNVELGGNLARTWLVLIAIDNILLDSTRALFPWGSFHKPSIVVPLSRVWHMCTCSIADTNLNSSFCLFDGANMHRWEEPAPYDLRFMNTAEEMELRHDLKLETSDSKDKFELTRRTRGSWAVVVDVAFDEVGFGMKILSGRLFGRLRSDRPAFAACASIMVVEPLWFMLDSVLEMLPLFAMSCEDG